MSWFVLYTKARAEKLVEARLLEQGVEAFLPLHTTKRKWSDRVKVVSVPLFNSYVFVNVKEHQLSALLSVNGVSRVVYYLRKPAVVRDEEITAIKEFLVIAENRKLVREGDNVQIISGPFSARVGKVLYVNEKIAMLFLEELGAKISVRVEELDKKTVSLKK